MNQGEKLIFDIFNTSTNQIRATNQRIQDIQESAIRLIEKPEKHYTREYLCTLTDTELIELIQGFHKKIQITKSELQKYGEYFEKNTNPEIPDLSLSFMVIEEAMMSLAKTINLRYICRDILIILLERGSINLP